MNFLGEIGKKTVKFIKDNKKWTKRVGIMKDQDKEKKETRSKSVAELFRKHANDVYGGEGLILPRLGKIEQVILEAVYHIAHKKRERGDTSGFSAKEAENWINNVLNDSGNSDFETIDYKKSTKRKNSRISSNYVNDVVNRLKKMHILELHKDRKKGRFDLTPSATDDIAYLLDLDHKSRLKEQTVPKKEIKGVEVPTDIDFDDSFFYAVIKNCHKEFYKFNFHMEELKRTLIKYRYGSEIYFGRPLYDLFFSLEKDAKNKVLIKLGLTIKSEDFINKNKVVKVEDNRSEKSEDIYLFNDKTENLSAEIFCCSILMDTLLKVIYVLSVWYPCKITINDKNKKIFKYCSIRLS